MRLFEYQAKEIFKSYGIPIPNAVHIQNACELQAALETIGLPCMLKAQVLQGGRGKAGLVKLVHTVEEAHATAQQFFTGKYRVRSILVEQAVSVANELYLAITMDPISGKAVIMGSAEGGVEIEKLAADAPERIIRRKIDLNAGLQPFQAADFVYTLGLRGSAYKLAQNVCTGLWQIFVSMDAELAEINPLFVTNDGMIMAGDGKLSIDDNSIYRHPEYKKSRAYYASDMEYEAAQEGLPYIEFGGDISLMVAGAGLANTVYDMVQYAGGSVANYLEFGGPNYMKAKSAMRICLKNKPKAILIVTFGTVARADVMAEGIVSAIQELQPGCPIIACLRGTGEDRVNEIFAPIGLKRITDTEEAVHLAVAAAAGRNVK